MIKNILTALVLFLFLSSCLKTRSEVGSQYQSQVYSKKQAENQSIEPVPSAKPIDERDELIRQMNGRIESLEYQVTALNQELTSLKQLQKDGFVNRCEHKTDTRAKSVTLSDSGKALAKLALKSVECVDRDFFAKLKQDEQKTLNALFGKLKNE